MENINELSEILKKIAQKLYESDILTAEELEQINKCINENNSSTYYQIACELLKRALRNNEYRALKNQFEKINEIAKQSIVINNELESYKKMIVKHFLGRDFPILLDAFFKIPATTNRLKIYIPARYLDTIMLEFYSFSSGIECNDENEYSKETAYIGNVLIIDIYPYFKKQNKVFLEDKIIHNGKKIKLSTEINSNILGLCFSDYEKNDKIETLEYAFMSSIDGNTAIDFIKAMYLKNKVNYRIVDIIEQNIYHGIIEEEKKNGLQKTS